MMNLMNALLKTYDYALDNNLVDNPRLSVNKQVLLPLYHSSKGSSGENIYEITLDEESNPVNGRFLDKDDIIVFPITEESIIRSGSKIAPHAICDELSYLSKGIDEEKNEAYLKGIEELLEYEKDNNDENFRIIGDYIIRNSILEDFLRLFLKQDEFNITTAHALKFNITGSDGKVKEKSLDLKKIFITFKVDKGNLGDISLSKDVTLHNFYMNYIKEKNNQSENKKFCNITGKKEYCVERHRGIIGNAKLVSISNNDETYYGRFKSGDEIYSISYEASQKVHNMLKYLLDNDNHKQYIGEGAYIVNWLFDDLAKGGIDLISGLEDEEDDFSDEQESTMEELGGGVSKKIGDYFIGRDKGGVIQGDFYVLIIEQISKGRVSIKYFRRFLSSEIYERVTKWYKSTEWKFYKKYKSPSIYQMVNFIYGQENKEGFLSCENKKLKRSAIERLLPCILEGKKIPSDFARTAFMKLSNKRAYKKSWEHALYVGCSLMKKHRYDDNDIVLPEKISEVKKMKESRSFNYGKLMAIYEKLELDAVRGKIVKNEEYKKKDEDDKKKGEPIRITNADKLWTSMIRMPERTMHILGTKNIRPYINMLKKNNPGLYVKYDKQIEEITLTLRGLNASNSNDVKGALNEDFLFGYYYQKNDLYKSKDETEKTSMKDKKK